MIGREMYHKVRRLKGKGKKNSEISRILGIHRDTVRKYLNNDSPPLYQRSKTTRDDPFADFEDYIRGVLNKDDNDDLSFTEIYELLVEEGFKGSYSTVKRRIKKMRPPKVEERFFEQEYKPGEQSQFDFKERIRFPFNDGLRELHLHFGTLPFSDKFFIRAYPNRNFECFMGGVHEFFEHIGGMTQNVRIDNLAPCVAKVLSGSKRKYTVAFKKAIEYYDFGVLPCAPAKGSDKGDVERDIKTHARRIQNLIKVKDLRFNDFDELNEWLAEYCKKRTTEKIDEKFGQEVESLFPLIKRDEEILGRVIEKMPSKYGMIKHDEQVFSVPDKAIGHKCKLVYGVHGVRIIQIDNAECVAIHPRDKSESILFEHVIPSLIRKPGAMARWAHRDSLFPMPIYTKLYKYLKKKSSFRAEQDYLKILNLIQNYCFDELTLAIELSLEDRPDVIYDRIYELLTVEHRPPNVIDISNKLNQRQINPDLSGYDSLIPGEKNDTSRIDPIAGRAEATSDEKGVLKFSDYCSQGKE